VRVSATDVRALHSLRFTPEMLTRPEPGRSGAETTLHHFAVVTYFVDPTLLKRHLHQRFEPLRVTALDGSSRALVSVVTFFDRDFRFTRWPRVVRSFGQTNYRAYVVDRTTGGHVAWFFGTCVDSITVAIPRYVWNLPWHRSRMTFECPYDDRAQRYASYRVTTTSSWAPGEVELEDSGKPATAFTGFASLESALVVLTHPLQGFFFRRDNRLGSYRIWHDRMQTTEGRIRHARYPLLADLGLVPLGDTRNIHSVLLQREIPFTIYLPPVALPD
jgi:hypothetical protein